MTVNSRSDVLSSEVVDDTDTATPASTQGARRRGRPSRRDAILQAAVELFAKGGSRGTCIAAIAERIGVTPPAVIHHFKTKEALLTAVVGVIDERRADLDFRSDEHRGPERLTLVGALGERLETNQELANLQRLATVMVAEALDRDDPRHDYFVGRHREFRARVAETLRIGVLEGWVRDDIDPEVGAIIVVGALQGMQIQWFLDPDRVPIATATETFVELLVHSLAPSTRADPGRGHAEGS